MINNYEYAASTSFAIGGLISIGWDSPVSVQEEGVPLFVLAYY